MGIIGITSSLTTLSVIIVIALSRSITLQKILKWVAIYSAISFLTDILLQVSSDNAIYPLLFTFTLLEYACFTWIFYMLLSKQLNKKLVVVGSFAFLVMVCITLTNYGSQHFDNVNSGTEAILIIVYSILYFSEKLNIDSLEPIFDSPGSFIVVACLFYLAGNLFLFLTSQDQSSNAWIINSLFNLIRNVFFLVAARKCTKMKKPVAALHLS